jgi:type VI secretion system secreted protein Hcp
MAFDAFLKIDGITGETQAGEIQLESFSWGASNPASIGSGTGGAGAGKVSFQDFSFTALAGKQSHQLFEALARGSTVGSALLTINHKTETLTIKFSDVFISSYKLDEGGLLSQKCSEGALPAVQLGAPVENVSFNFTQVSFGQTGSAA